MKRIGIIGCGNISRTHVWALSHMNDVVLTACADLIEDRAVNLARSYEESHSCDSSLAKELSIKVKTYHTLEQMLDAADLDVVHICTPHYLHVPMAKECLKRGVSVFSEKPPAINMKQFNSLSEALDGQARLGFCFQNRYNQTTKKADEIIASGRLGQVIGARAFVTWKRDEGYYQSDWKGRLATEGGGALINQSIHTLDLILRYLGTPLDVKASVANHHLEGVIEVEDTVEAWMSFAEGKRACFYASTGYVTDAPVILELQCEHGSISIMDKMVTVKADGEDPEYIKVMEKTAIGKSYWGNGHLACIRDFYDKLDSGERFPNDLEGVRNTMETMMRIYKRCE